MTLPTAPSQTPATPARFAARFALAAEENLLRPIRGLRLIYLPMLLVYFAYGALGLIDVTRDLWIKESLSLTPSHLAAIATWLLLPWTVKMVFGELVDTMPMFGSQRKSYILIGALLMATGLLILAVLSNALGTLTERWLFFAEAKHTVTLYYGAETA